MVTIVDLLYSALIIVIALAVAVLSWIVIKRYVSQIAAKTETKIDDIIISVVRFPLFISILLAGFNIAVRRLGILGEYLVYFDASFYAVWTVIAGYVVYKVIDYAVPTLAERAEIPKTPAEIIRKVLKWVIVAATLLVLLGVFGVNLGGVISIVMIVLGTLIFLAFASWSIMANIVAAIVLMIWRPIEVGDYIELSPDNILGRVEDINLMFTRMRLKTGDVINIPNTMIMQKYIKNLSKSPRLLIQLTYTASSGEDPEKVGRKLLEAAEATPGILKNPKPFYRIKEIGNGSVVYELNAYTSKVHEADEITSMLRLNILKNMQQPLLRESKEG
ncbi:MAG TPA: mechanosensitive ion channel [Candidatus Caldiarchaeum subterraneum]|uniref:Mechanosensitive ion channel n=1 Tax=Caldiarchaeum subterraneum TaxID=311458 RepID=A0A832ZUZ0_CALS0|nr:mechanosensitive ion channel [Candidatus Caldarchaeum subterraneum]